MWQGTQSNLRNFHRPLDYAIRWREVQYPWMHNWVISWYPWRWHRNQMPAMQSEPSGEENQHPSISEIPHYSPATIWGDQRGPQKEVHTHRDWGENLFSSQSSRSNWVGLQERIQLSALWGRASLWQPEFWSLHLRCDEWDRLVVQLQRLDCLRNIFWVLKEALSREWYCIFIIL